MLASKVDPPSVPYAMAKTKPRVMNNVDPTQDPTFTLGQMFDQETTNIM